MPSSTPPRAGWRWAWRMAGLDARRYRARLLLFLSAILLGVASLVSIQSLSESLRAAVADESKSLLGADLVISGSQPYPDSIQTVLDSLPGQRTQAAAFLSMVSFPKNDGTRLAEIRAHEAGYPFYGTFACLPLGADAKLWQGPYAMVDETVLTQFGIEVGDSIRIGEATFAVAARLQQAPGGASGLSFGSPRVYVDYKYLDQTRLIKYGSRVSYLAYYRLADTLNADAWQKTHTKLLEDQRMQSTTVKDRQDSLGALFGNLFKFFNLVAFIALLLGGVGVASSVQVYLRERIPTMALLRTLGARSGLTTRVYLYQILQTALVGSLVGAGLGIALQLAWPYLLEGLLPVPVKFVISFPAVGLGLVVGLGISLLFALLPLIRVRRVSPLIALRADVDAAPARRREPLIFVIYAAIALSIIGFATLQLEGLKEGIIYTLGIGLAALGLAGVAWLLLWGLKRFVPRGISYILRQGLANLYRPRNQTMVLLITLGLGTFLLGSLYFLQENLSQQVDFSAKGDGRPNLILFDIQTDQVKGVDSLLRANNAPVVETTPVVTVRMDKVRGKTYAELRADSTLNIPWWAGEYRVSYRDSLMPSERILRGKLQPRATKDSILISVAENLRDIYKLKLGDKVEFNVQGVPMVTYVGSFRTIDFLSGSSSFQILFPAGVLEPAPQFFFVTSIASSKQQSGAIQSVLVKRYPNVSVVDLAATLDNAQKLIGQIALVIRFLASFSLFTGLIVLIAAILNSSGQRLRENVLLRTLGAKSRQLYSILTLEYLLLGLLASVTGIGLSLIASWLIVSQTYKTDFKPSVSAILLAIGLVTLLTTFLGVAGGYRLVRRPPLAILRETMGA